MKPMGTFLDFCRLYVYVHWMFFHFFFFQFNELLAKSTILLNDSDYCTCLDIWTDEKVNYFGYCYLLLFLHSPFLGLQFQVDVLFSLFYAVM